MNLDERVRRATAALLERADTVDRDRLYARITTRPRRRWVLATVAAATAAAAVAAVLVVPRLVDRGVRIDEPPFVDTAPAPRSGAGASTGTWRRVPDPDGLFGGPGEQVITALAVANGVAVAVGGDGEHGDQAAIWRAAQPDRWERVAADLCGEASCTIGDVTTVAEVFVAVGQLDGLPKAWWSEDGADWTRIDLPVPAGDRPAVSPLTALQDIVSSGDGPVVALGSIERGDGRVQPVAYRADGLDGDWRYASFGPAFERESPVGFDALTSFAGRYVAIAHAGDGFDFAHSDDGLTWELTRPTPGVFEPYPSFPATLVVDGERLLALGTFHGEDEVDGAVWASDDGVGWRRVDAEGLGGTGQQAVHGAGVVGGSIVAVGRHFPGGMEATQPAAWQRRADGTWRRLDGDGSFDTLGLLTTTAQLDGHSLLVAGSILTDDRPDAALWTYTLEGDGPDARRAADCSAAVMPADLTPGAGLPPAAADLREALYDAAVACDHGRLEALATRGQRPFTFSFGAGEGDAPAAYWQMLERDEPGSRPLWYLAQLLRLPHGQVETKGSGVLIVWPRAAASERPTDAEYEELADAGLYGAAETASFRELGGYVGWRVGITPDGEWIFFVAGD